MAVAVAVTVAAASVEVVERAGKRLLLGPQSPRNRYIKVEYETIAKLMLRALRHLCIRELSG